MEKFLCDVWLPAAERTVAASTLSGYRSHVRHYLVPHLGQIHLHRLTAERVNAFYSHLARTKSARRRRPPSATTIRRIHATLHRALNDAVRWSYIEKNPAAQCDPPRLDARAPTMRTWSAEEASRFVSLTSDHSLGPVWVLLLTTGMRRGEVLGLRWGDVDLLKATAAVRQTVTVVDRQIRIGAPKSRRSGRVVALDDESVRILKTLHDHRVHPDAETLVFTNDGRPLDPVKVSKIFRRFLEQTDLPRIRLHDLRHTHATLALQAGIHPKVVSERLGHATVSLTLDVYSHALPNMQQEAARRIGDLIFGART